MKRAIQLFAIATLCLAVTGLSSSIGHAKKYKYQGGYKYYGKMRIESRFSPNKYIIAPIRRAPRFGNLEARLPNGHWLDCEGNCRWAVQREYLDIFEYQMDPFGPGYFRFEFYLD